MMPVVSLVVARHDVALLRHVDELGLLLQVLELRVRLVLQVGRLVPALLSPLPCLDHVLAMENGRER